MSDTPQTPPKDIGEALESAEVLHFPAGARPARGNAQAPDTVLPPQEAAGGQGDGPPEDPPPDEPAGGGDGGSDGSIPIVEAMNREWALVLAGSRAVIIRERDDALPEERVRILTVDAFKAYYQNSRVSFNAKVREDTGQWVEKRVYKQRAPFWLAHRSRRTYDGLCFFPNPDGVPTPEGYFNLWRGFSVTPDRSATAEERARKYAVFTDHLRTNVCNGDEHYFKWIWGWMAQMLQQPRKRIGTAIVLRGKMGTGKSIVGKVLGSLIASHFFQVDDSRYLVGQFNAHLAHCLLLQVDEGFWAGDKSAEGRLKGLVTAEKQMIEQKGIDPIRVDNYVRLFFSSNEGWVVPAGLEERRFAVFDVADHCQQDIAYFAELEEQLENGGREALLADLLDYDLNGPEAADLRRIPKTGALLEQKLHSLDPVTQWWFQRLMDGSATHRAGTWAKSVPISAVYADYARTADRIGVRRKQSEIEFGLRMRRIVPSLAKRRSWEDIEVQGEGGYTTTVRKRVWVYDLPALQDCRDVMAEMLGQDVDWGEDDESETSGADARPQGEDPDVSF